MGGGPGNEARSEGRCRGRQESLLQSFGAVHPQAGGFPSLASVSLAYTVGEYWQLRFG